jgi:hypothetical protein
MPASILITANDDYTLYINGVPIGSGSNWQVAQHYTVNFVAGTTEVVFAVLATNVTPSAATTAALIVAAKINMQLHSRVCLGVGRIVEVDPSSFKIFMSFITILHSLCVFDFLPVNIFKSFRVAHSDFISRHLEIHSVIGRSK